MKERNLIFWALLLLLGTVLAAQAQRTATPTTPYTRTFLRAADAAAARTILEVSGTGLSNVTETASQVDVNTNLVVASGATISGDGSLLTDIPTNAVDANFYAWVEGQGGGSGSTNWIDVSDGEVKLDKGGATSITFSNNADGQLTIYGSQIILTNPAAADSYVQLWATGGDFIAPGDAIVQGLQLEEASPNGDTFRLSIGTAYGGTSRNWTLLTGDKDGTLDVSTTTATGVVMFNDSAITLAADANANGKSITNLNSLEVTNAANITTVNATNLTFTSGTASRLMATDADKDVSSMLPGTAGQVLTSAGDGALPTWEDFTGFSYDITGSGDTSDETLTPISTNAVTDDTSELWKVNVLAAGVTNSAAYELHYLLRNEGGTLALTASNAVSELESDAAMDATLTIDSTNATINATGVAGENIHWTVQGIIQSTTNYLAAAPGAPITNGAIAYYHMDSGTAWPDEANSFDLTENGSLSVGTGFITNAADFSATSPSTYLSHADNDAFSALTNSLTIMGWFNLTDTNAASYAVTKNTTTDGGREYQLSYSTTSNSWVMNYYTNASSASSLPVYSTTVISPNKWYYVVGVVDKDNLRSAIRVGDTNALGAWEYSATWSGFGGTNTTAILQVGRLNGSLGYTGYIDEVGMWSRVLSDTEITNIWTAGTNGTSWPFE